DVFRLAGNLVGVQRQEDFLFLGNGFFGNLIRSDELRVAGRHVHGNFTRQLTVTTLEGHQHANAMAVQVGTDHVTFGASQATDVDVFTALGNQGFTSRLHVSDQRSSIAVSCAEGFFDALGDECLEIFLQSQEVGLRVDFDDYGRLAIISNLDCNGTFGGDVAGLLGSLDGASGAHVVDGLFDIATGSGQGLLAIHHALASTLTQFFNQGCSNLCHVSNPLKRVFNQMPGRPDTQFGSGKKGASPPFCSTGHAKALRAQPAAASEADSSTNSATPPAFLPRSTASAKAPRYS